MNGSLKKILLVSLVLNALLIGLMLGQASQKAILPADKENVISMGVAKLPQEKRKAFEEGVRNIIKRMEASHGFIMGSKRQMLQGITANPFDEQAYFDKVKGLFDQHMEMKLGTVKQLGDFAKQYTPEERAILADILLKLLLPPPPPGPKPGL